MGDLVKYNDLEIKIMELYAVGKTKEEISLILDIPLTEVKKVFYKPKVREKINEIIEQKEIMLREKHLSILDDLTEKMIEKADGDLLKTLHKDRDILDIISLTSKVNKETEKKRLGVSDNNVIVQILNQLSE